MKEFTGDGGAIQGAVLPELFARIAREKSTGALLVHRGEEISRAYFREGRLVGAMVFGRFKPLGITFLEAGAIDIEALNSSLSIIAKAKVPQGQVLVEMGAITEEQLDSGLRGQLVACAAAFLLLPDGEWSFEAEPEFPDWTEGIRVRPGKAVIEAFRRPEAEPLLHDILDELGSTCLSLRVEAPQATEYFDLEPDEARALSHINGESEVQEITSTCHLDLGHTLALVGALSVFHLVAAAGSDHEIADLVPHLEPEAAPATVPVVPAPVSLSTPNVGRNATPKARPPVRDDAGKAKKLFEEGMKFFQRENYEGALPFLRDAVHLEPTQGLWTAYFAWALYRVGPPEVVVPQVRQLLTLASDSEEGGDRARYFLGMITETESDNSLDAWL